MTYTFDYATFIALFPQFNNTVVYSEAALEAYWTVGTDFISTRDYGLLNGNSRGYALNLLAAHIALLANRINAGKATGLVQAATIDKVAITLLPQPVQDAFEYWLKQTPYGVQLLALLDVKTVGGITVGGSPVYGSFRGPAGNFPQ